MPFSASQTFPSRPSGVHLAHAGGHDARISFLGRDAFLQGQGHMLIKILGWIPVADASGPTTDQGTMLRYLGETVWFPAGALHPAIAWEQIDDTRARDHHNPGQPVRIGPLHLHTGGPFRPVCGQTLL